jgi:23S rRNA (uracil1939-C5)-methyltransferase
MGGAARAAHALARALSSLGKPLDILITATQTGLDVDVRGCGELEEGPRHALIAEAARLDLARVSNHGQVVIERRPPVLPMGRAVLQPPPGAFLQATQAGEELLAQLACERAGKARRVLDLFSGVGTFALRLAEKATVHAVENDRAALASLIRASGDAGPALKPITTDVRDLFKRPLPVLDLEAFDVVLFDPPRAGAEAQAREIALSKVPVVIAVSCNVQTFARDARILIDGGYSLDEVTPVDQFRHSAHVEMVATFRKQRVTGQTKGKGNRKRLLG